jgi:hypothetical protein
MITIDEQKKREQMAKMERLKQQNEEVKRKQEEENAKAAERCEQRLRREEEEDRVRTIQREKKEDWEREWTQKREGAVKRRTEAEKRLNECGRKFHYHDELPDFQKGQRRNQEALRIAEHEFREAQPEYAERQDEVHRLRNEKERAMVTYQ